MIKFQDILFLMRGILYCNVNVQPIYMLPDGEHVILGDIFNISKGETKAPLKKTKIFSKE